MTDGELVRETLRGRNAAYEDLVRRWAPRVLALCHARIRRPDAAEDLAQEALVRSFAALPTLAEPDKFGPWILGIATRACLDWLKAKARTQVRFSELGLESPEESFAAPAVETASAAERDEELRDLMDEVHALPEELRTVVMLYYYDDVTYAELAAALGVSAATVNMRLTKARAILRRRLSPARRDS